MTEPTPRILVAGASGYIGSRLVPRLLESGYPVRALARNRQKMTGRPWSNHPALEIVEADLLDHEALVEACRGCAAAFYLVHSMNPSVSDFAATDRRAAENMAQAAASAGLKQIVYLGGLGEEREGLSEHLRSRSEVGAILRQGRVPVTILRAAMIIGSGSASFEILRYLVERLPVMITPRWVSTACQPIAVRNVLHYLIGCLSASETLGETFDIGQPESVTYRELMTIYAEEAGLKKRLILPVPVLTPRLSSYWIHLVTPVPAALARPLAEGLRNTVVCTDSRIRKLIPQRLLDCREAIRVALAKTRGHQVESSWREAGIIPPAEWASPDDPAWAGGTRFEDARRIVLEAPTEAVWKAVIGIGGSSGWYYADWLWAIRGMIDRLAGGVGLRRGRRCPLEVHPGDALDFWRVLEVDRPKRLLLVAEMKLPGQALLAFALTETTQGHTALRLVARFLPRGVSGLAYWYAVVPFHNLVFRGMLHGIAKRVGCRVLQGPERLE